MAADDYPNRLVKYVPAEVIAFFIFASTLPTSNPQRWFVVLIGLAGNIVITTRLRASVWWTPILSALAFLAWAIGTTDYGEQLLGIPQTWSALLLSAAVFLVPLMDGALDRSQANR